MPAELPTRSNLRTPKAAAIAGIVFSVLLITAFGFSEHQSPPIRKNLARGYAAIRAS